MAMSPARCHQSQEYKMAKIPSAVVLGAALAATPAAAQEKTFDGPSVTLITGVDESSTAGSGQTGVLYGDQVG
jgi:hypothetical protein